MGNRIANLALFLFVVACVVGGAFILSDAAGALDLWRAEQATRRAEAEAQRLQAEVELSKARADVTRAEGEKAVLEAAARSVDADRRLVAWYTFRGDLRGVLALVGALGLAICGGALYVILKGANDAKHTDHA